MTIKLDMNSLCFPGFEEVELCEFIPNWDEDDKINGFVVALNMPRPEDGSVVTNYWALPTDLKRDAISFVDWDAACAYLDGANPNQL